MTASKTSGGLQIPFIAAIVSTLVMGFFHWRIPYSEVDFVTLIAPWLIISTVLGVLFSHREIQIGLLRGAAVAVGGPLAVVLRVIVEVVADPTSHNLWPFEIIIAGILTGPTALLGAFLGSLIRRRTGRSGNLG
jgi:hypothetical protein